MTKVYTTVSTLLAGALIPANAQAQTREGFEVSGELIDYSYREQLYGETIVYDDGIFGGAAVTYVETVGGNLFLRGELSVAVGSVDYRSPDPAGDQRLNDVRQSIGQLELQIGVDLPLRGGVMLSPFTGLASRALIDESGGKATAGGLAGYDREIGFAYIPAGAGLSIPVSGGASSIILSAQYNFVVNGTSESKFSDVDPSLPDVKLDLDDGHGFEASAVYRMPLGGHAVSFGPFVRHWKLDRSDSFIVTNPDDPSEAIEIFEPRSRTNEIGFRVSFAF